MELGIVETLVYTTKLTVRLMTRIKMKIFTKSFKRRFLSFFPKHIKYLIFIYLTGLIFFTAFRLLLLFTDTDKLSDIPSGKFILVLKAMFMGFRFDTVVSGYILLLPTVFLSILSILLIDRKIAYRITNIYLIIVYSVAFFISASDIPYFHQFFSRFSTAAFNWVDTPGFVASMIFQEFHYWGYIIPLLFSILGFSWIIIRIRKKIEKSESQYDSKFSYVLKIILLSIVLWGVLFIGIRGRLENKAPIKVGTAYFSNYAFLNLVGLNPVFTLIRSYLNDLKSENQSLNLCNQNEAIAYVRKSFKVDNNEEFDSPVARRIKSNSKPTGSNLVLVIMESMSAAKMSRFGNTDNLTPNLDSIARISYSFDSVYTAGTHTFNGVFSTLFAYPALKKQHLLQTIPILSYTGIANTLKNTGYQTIYFTTHDSEFDNTGGFLSNNGFERIVAHNDYPENRKLSTLGVPDDFMFEFSIPILNELSKRNKPFFATFMTASDHGPYVIPENIPFSANNETNISKQIVEYADWSIKKFLELASREKWFNNTIFVFIADHGGVLNSIYDMPLSYHHTPFIIHAPKIFTENKVINKLGGQIDVFPTLMEIMNITYVNNTMGIDLINDRRDYIYFCADEKIGCLSNEYYLIVRETGLESLYKYKQFDRNNYIDSLPEVTADMKKYVFSMMQTAQYVIKNNLVGKQDKY